MSEVERETGKIILAEMVRNGEEITFKDLEMWVGCKMKEEEQVYKKLRFQKRLTVALTAAIFAVLWGGWLFMFLMYLI